MNQQDLVEKLKSKGLKVSTAAISRYSKHDLIPEPEKTHGGQATGPLWNYPEEAIAEAGAAYFLLKEAGLNYTAIKEIRLQALKVEQYQAERIVEWSGSLSQGNIFINYLFVYLYITVKKAISNGMNPYDVKRYVCWLKNPSTKEVEEMRVTPTPSGGAEAKVDIELGPSK